MGAGINDILNKIKSANSVLKKLDLTLVNNEKKIISELQNNLSKIDDEFRLKIIHAARKQSDVAISNLIMSNQYLTRIDDLITDAQNKVNKFNIKKRQLNELTKQFKSYSSGCDDMTIPQNNTNRCDLCDALMIEMPSTAELMCRSCSYVKNSFIYEEIQQFNKNIIHHSANNSIHEHLKKSWDRLLAKEPESELINKNKNMTIEELIANIKNVINRDRKISHLLTVPELRDILEEIGRSDLYKNTSLVLKKLNKIGPPQPPLEIEKKVFSLFIAAVEILSRINNYSSRTCYSFYFFQILDIILPKNSTYRRILFYIYFQKDETIEKRLNDWRLICNEIPELEFRQINYSLKEEFAPINFI